MDSQSNAEVGAILASEAKRGFDNPKNLMPSISTEEVATAQTKIQENTTAIRGLYIWLEDTLNEMGYAQEVGAEFLGHAVAYSMDKPTRGRVYVSDVGGTLRRHHSEVPIGVLARALPTIRKIIANVKKESVVQGHTLDMHLKAYEAGR